LRRFLDKNYITNGIVYAGAAHIATFVSILVKEFNFKITHVAKSKFDNIEQLEKEIINSGGNFENVSRIMELLDVFNSKQCSDISTFPKNFS
jgi:hypothetical protein